EGVFLVLPDADGLFRLPGLAAVAQRRLVLVGAVALHASNYVIGFDNEVAGHNRRRAGRRIMAVTHGRGARADHRAHDDAADHEADAERSALNFEQVAHDEHPIVPYRGTIVARWLCNPLKGYRIRCIEIVRFSSRTRYRSFTQSITCTCVQALSRHRRIGRASSVESFH